MQQNNLGPLPGATAQAVVDSFGQIFNKDDQLGDLELVQQYLRLQRRYAALNITETKVKMDVCETQLAEILNAKDGNNEELKNNLAGEFNKLSKDLQGFSRRFDSVSQLIDAKFPETIFPYDTTTGEVSKKKSPKKK